SAQRGASYAGQPRHFNAFGQARVQAPMLVIHRLGLTGAKSQMSAVRRRDHAAPRWATIFAPSAARRLLPAQPWALERGLAAARLTVLFDVVVDVVGHGRDK